jgi:hypothetical protein
MMGKILTLPEKITVEERKNWEGGWGSIVYKTYKMIKVKQEGGKIIIEYEEIEEKEYLFSPTGC